jgi:hypothetical protein
MKFAQAADVIDVRMGADDGFYCEFVTAEKVQDAIYFVAGVNHQRFARDGISDDRAVALQHPYGDGDVNQSIDGGIDSCSTVAHDEDYITGHRGGIPGRRRVACPAR